MDLSKYPNLSKWPLIKNGGLYKKKHSILTSNLSSMTDEELTEFDSQIPSGLSTVGLLITPSGVIKFKGSGKKAVIENLIPTKNIIYIYGNVMTNSMNFIPISKLHSVCIYSTDHNITSSNSLATGGFSKKDVTGPIIEEIKNCLNINSNHILYGYTPERHQEMLRKTLTKQEDNKEE